MTNYINNIFIPFTNIFIPFNNIFIILPLKIPETQDNYLLHSLLPKKQHNSRNTTQPFLFFFGNSKKIFNRIP